MIVILLHAAGLTCVLFYVFAGSTQRADVERPANTRGQPIGKYIIRTTARVETSRDQPTHEHNPQGSV
ncbi:hypothetical protein LSAT2_020413 [Lamellibrachia satsuma]|nr:hypothetical protein LSAT2_020413 [Lamellibrachia satsuma]